MGAVRVQHLAEQPVKFKALRRGSLCGQALSADHVLVGADQAHLRPRLLLQNGLEEISGGGLSVGAGDGGHHHSLRRVAEPVGPQNRQRPPGLLHQHEGNVSLRLPFTDGAHRACLLCLTDIGVAVHGIAADGHKQVPCLRLPGIIADTRKLHVFVRVKLQHLRAGKQIL
ncbi:hypothetical protein SDC9_96761 [bioreactor metagenome]|uniref:Uncharacterized protein n=1 Tax=bioreactor metagenome TaxID=1076179 RepID=A0A645AAJ5_9ZZZZ